MSQFQNHIEELHGLYEFLQLRLLLEVRNKQDTSDTHRQLRKVEQMLDGDRNEAA
jgi:hypothetical protein